MGRPPKYANDDERREARKRSRREYYARNINRERKSSLNRWHRTRQLSPDPEDSQLEIVLLSTAVALGPMLSVKETTSLKSLATCLRFDLTSWRDLTPEKQKWIELTEGLLALRRSQRSPRKLLRDIERIKLLAIVVQDVAREGEREAQRRNPEEETEEYLLLSNIAVDAGAIVRSSKELEDLFNRGGDLLKNGYKQQALYWQCS